MVQSREAELPTHMSVYCCSHPLDNRPETGPRYHVWIGTPSQFPRRRLENVSGVSKQFDRVSVVSLPPQHTEHMHDYFGPLTEARLLGYVLYARKRTGPVPFYQYVQLRPTGSHASLRARLKRMDFSRHVEAPCVAHLLTLGEGIEHLAPSHIMSPPRERQAARLALPGEGGAPILIRDWHALLVDSPNEIKRAPDILD